MEKVRISKECLKGITSSTSPCILPILSGPFPILENSEQGKSISVKSVIPPVFEMLLLATNSASKAFHVFVKRCDKYINWVEVTGIAFLIIATAAIITNNLTGLSGYFARWFLFLNRMS